MPELPEVEVMKRGLAPWCERAVIRSVRVLDGRLRYPVSNDFAAALLGKKIGLLEVYGKYLLMPVDAEWVIVWHMGMSGRLLVSRNDAPNGKHDRIRLSLSTGVDVIFRDPRRFGYVALLLREKLPSHPWFCKLGPDALSKGFNTDWLWYCCRRSKQPIKAKLMDSAVVAGVGNIYACEALHAAGIHPFMPAYVIERARLEDLIRAVRDVLLQAIACGGSTIRDYQQVNGDQGYFQHRFRVYGRAGLSCLRCCGEIVRKKLAGRSTYFCSQCQR